MSSSLCKWLLHDLGLPDDSLKFIECGGADIRFLSDERVALVIGVVGVPHSAIREELKL